MTVDVSFPVAFVGGLVSFASPCVLPLVPVYVALVTGTDVGDISAARGRHLGRVAANTGLFVVGFGTVFTLLGASATVAGQMLVRNQVLLTRAAGLLVLGFALFLLASLLLRASWLSREARWHPDLSRYGPWAAPVAGAAFGLGWTPCIGPVLGSLLALAATREGAGQGAALLATYALGLGVPFLLTGLLLGQLGGVLQFVRRHHTGLVAVTGGVMALFGVLLTFNQLTWVTSQLQTALGAVGLDILVTLG